MKLRARAGTPAGPERLAETEGAPAVVVRPDGRRCGAALTSVPPALTVLLACLWGIGERAVWRDEHATWWAASLSFHDLGALLRNTDAVLAPYYVFMHAWTALFGDSPTALRLPSALAMAAAGGLTGLLGRRLVGTRGGLAAGLLFALVPTVARYGQEARPYAFALLAALLSTHALLRALDRPTRPAWAWYAATVALTGWSHLVALALLPAHFAAVRHTRVRAHAAAAAGTGVLLVLPIALWARTQSEQIAWNTTAWNDVAAMPYMLFRSPVMAVLVLGCATPALHAAWTGRGRQPGRGTWPLLILWAAFPLLATLATTTVLHLFLQRYLLFTVPAWILLAVLGLRRLADAADAVERRRRALACAAAVLLAAVAAAALFLDRPAVTGRNDPHEPDYASAATTVSAGQRPGDGIAYAGGRRARRAIAYELRDRPRPRDVFLHRTARELGGYEAEECPRPAPCAAAFDRIWLVSAAGGDPYAAMPRGKAALLRTQFRTVRTERFASARVLLLQRVRPADR